MRWVAGKELLAGVELAGGGKTPCSAEAIVLEVDSSSSFKKMRERVEE